MSHNLILLTDSYKVTHWKQYPKNTENVYSYFESRGGKFSELVFFGLQYIIKEYLSKPVTMVDIKEAEFYLSNHLNPDLFNQDGWLSLLDKHNGYLPIRIKAVPEGMVCPTSVPLVTVENTDSQFYWLTNYIETLLVQLWYPITVATLSYQIKKVIAKSLEMTGTPELIDWKLHDFGFRGVSSVESAKIGGAAHLINFNGTDTLPALQFINQYYQTNQFEDAFFGGSIPAAEHSTITSWGRENEVKAFENMINQFGEGKHGAYAVVSDSYNIFDACTKLWGDQLKDKVLGAKNTLIVRPDSGDPVTVVLEVLERLSTAFGYTVNEKGFKVLNPKIRVIQGDGVDYESIQKIADRMYLARWSSDNIAFGCGGALLQRVDRDTQQFAFKCSNIKGKDFDRGVYKDPITSKSKKSKIGRFDSNPNLEMVFENGKLLKELNWADIRNNVNNLKYKME